MRVPGIQYVQGRNSYSDADGTKTGVAIHNTSNTAGAAAEASYATRRTDGVSAHFYVDGTTVIQSLDTTARAGHAGSSQGNQNAVAVEIRGQNSWSRQTWLDNVCWALLGDVLAAVCRAYGIQVRRASVSEMQSNPKVRAFYSHDDMRRAWGGTDHTDPGPGFPWDRLFSAVTAGLNGGDDDMANLGYGDRDGEFLCERERALLFLDKASMGPEKGTTYPAVELLKRLEQKLDDLRGRPAVDAAALAAALAPLLTEHLGVEISAEQLVTALQSDAGQAALVQAANKAEDS